MDAFAQSFDNLFGVKRGRSSSRIQYVGDSRDRTEQFKRKREELKRIAERRTRDKLEQLARWFETSNTRASGGLLHSLSWSPTNPHCLSCGTRFSLILRKYPCKLCEKSFCSKCIKKLTDQDITGVISKGESMEVCDRCRIVVMREDYQRKYNLKFANSVKEWSPFVEMFESLKTRKDIILKLSAQYEYLASSIKDLSHSSKKPTQDNFSSIYESASNMEKELFMHFKAYEKTLTELVQFPVKPESREEKLKKNLQASFVSVIQDNLPAFKRLKQGMTKIELNTVNNLYLIIHRLCIENMRNKSFWNQYGASYGELLKIIKQDLMSATSQAGEKWGEHKIVLEDFLNTWDSHSKPILQGNTETEFEAVLIRKNINVLNESAKKLRAKIGSEAELPCTEALLSLIQRLEGKYYSTALSFERGEPLFNPQELDDWSFL